ncbi:MAG: hypothetical protein JW894_12455 [Bacteroidales bacterium]|nr:hypothetical protein [Bacteroidales bacterium]
MNLNIHLYINIAGDTYPWLFADFNTISFIAEETGFESVLIATGEHYDYLGILKKKI